MLQKILSKLLDLPSPINEANKKLTNTYCIVNGELVYIEEVTAEGLLVKIGDNIISIKDKEVFSFEVWLPETGMYLDKYNSYIEVVKHPRRQWRKSFSLSFYSINVLVHRLEISIDKTRTPINLFEAKKVNDVWKDEGNIYYCSTTIASCLKGKITVINNLFEQEIKEFIQGELNGTNTKGKV